MYRTRFSLLIIFLFYLFLNITVKNVHAQALTFAQPFEHPGLQFSSPLTFEQNPLPLKPITLKFGLVEEIDIQPTTKQQIAVEMIVTPTPSPDIIPPIEKEDNIHPSPQPSTIGEKNDLPASPPTPTPKPASPSVTTIPTSGGLNAEVLFTMVNSYRASKGLPAFQKDERTCSLAVSRAPEIENEVANNTMHSGLRTRNLSYWNTENIISMRNETEAFNWWINDQIHREAIESNNTYSCIACSGNSCAEEFTNYQPK